MTSANSNAAGDCPTTSMAGTSMATPITAGATALIRQYLRQGYFPTGQKGNQNGEEDGVPQYQVVIPPHPMRGQCTPNAPRAQCTRTPNARRTELPRLPFLVVARARTCRRAR